MPWARNNSWRYIKIGPEGDDLPEYPAGKAEITTAEEVDVAAYATAQVTDDNLAAENIKKNVSILGITGEFEGSGGATGKEVTLVNSQTVTFESGGEEYNSLFSDSIYGNPNGIPYDSTFANLPDEITVTLDGTDYALPKQYDEGTAFYYYGAAWVTDYEIDFTDYPISVSFDFGQGSEWWFNVASGASHTIAVKAVITEQKFTGYGEFDATGLESVFFDNLHAETWDIHITSPALSGVTIYSDIGASDEVEVLVYNKEYNTLMKQLQISLDDGVDDTYQIYKLSTASDSAKYVFRMSLPSGKTASVTGDVVMGTADQFVSFTCTGSGTITIT